MSLTTSQFKNIAQNGKFIASVLLLYVSLFVFSISLPVAFIFAMFLLSFLTNTIKPVVFLIAALISIINLLKWPESDALNYINYFNFLKGFEFDELIASTYLSIKGHEFLFKAHTWISGIIFSNSVHYIFISVLFIYSSLIESSISIANSVTGYQSKGLPPKSTLIVLVFWCAFVAASFIVAGHLLRQYIAFALFFYGVMIHLKGNNKIGLLVIFSSVAVHYMMLVFCIIYIVSRVAKFLFTTKNRLYSLSIVILSSVLAAYYGLFFEVIQQHVYEIPSQEKVSPFLMFIDASIFTLFLYLFRRDETVTVQFIICFTVLFIGGLIVIYDFDYIFLRYYLVLDFIRAILGSLILTRINFQPKIIFVPIFCCICVLIFALRLEYSVWDYGGSFLDTMSLSLEGVGSRIEYNYY